MKTQSGLFRPMLCIKGLSKKLRKSGFVHLELIQNVIKT